MRRLYVCAICAVLASSSFALRADDRPLLQRIAERTPMPLVEIEHSMQRAGYPLNVKPHAKPSMTRFDHGGYVGGGTLRGNSFLASGPGSATGPVHDGTYGTDFGGFRAHLGRVFLAPSYDPSRNGRPIYLAYRAETIRVTDVFALRPFRKAVLEKREDKEHGHGEHKEGEHGKGEGH